MPQLKVTWLYAAQCELWGKEDYSTHKTEKLELWSVVESKRREKDHKKTYGMQNLEAVI